MIAGSLLSLLITASAVVAKPSLSAVPGAYMFEFEDGADIDAFQREYADHAATRRHINRSLFKGTSIHFHDPDTAEKSARRLAVLPGVKGMWNVHQVERPNEVVWTANPNKDYTMQLKRRADDYDDDDSQPHAMTQVDKLRKEGYTGRGIRVAIVDSGIDYEHPSLGGCYGKDCLVGYGQDMIPESPPGNKTDGEPFDCDGHGTHVAGIVAAQSNPFGFTGAAPGVTLGSYRVFDCMGIDTADDAITDAFLAAYDDDSDIINASLGESIGWHSSVFSEAVDRISKEGVICVIAAGNEGDHGLFFGSDPAVGETVSAVASLDNDETPELLTLAAYSIDDHDEEDFGYKGWFGTSSWAGESIPLYATSHDVEIPDDACDPLPDDTPDLGDHIVLIRQGTCDFETKAEHAAEFGAEYIIFYANKPGVEDDYIYHPDIVAAGMVPAEEGELWVEALDDSAEVVLHMTDPDEADDVLVHANNTLSGGYLSDFTTWGPSWELDLKPNFGAPGGEILSTYLQEDGSYAVLAGTSMAAPLAAAAIALVLEARGALDPIEIRNLLAATAKPVSWHDGNKDYNFLAPVPQQGAGIIQAYDAAFAHAVVDVSGISFNDSEHFASEKKFSIDNVWDQPIEFEFDHVPAAMAYTHAPDSQVPADFPNEVTDDYATIELSCNKFTVEPGKSKSLTVTATPPEDVDEDRLPVWSGYINLHGDDGSILRVPYIGVSGNMRDQPVLAEEIIVADPLSFLDEDGDEVESLDDVDIVPLSVGNHTFDFPFPGETPDYGEMMMLQIEATFGVRIMYVDAVPADANGTAHLALDGLLVGRPGTDVRVLGALPNTPLEYDTRWAHEFWWDGEMEDGSYAPEGRYKIVARALRVFGDMDDEDDWDVLESEAFSIRYKDEDEDEEDEDDVDEDGEDEDEDEFVFDEYHDALFPGAKNHVPSKREVVRAMLDKRVGAISKRKTAVRSLRI